jgi:hypothetical protein
MTAEPVICRSDTTYAERPIIFEWQGEWLTISQIISRWREPSGLVFRVQTDELSEYELIYNLSMDSWQVREI